MSAAAKDDGAKVGGAGGESAGGPPAASPGLPGRAALAIFLGALLLRGIALVDLALHDPWFASPVVDESTNVEDARRIAREGPRIEKPYWKPPLYPHLVAIAIEAGIGSERPHPGPEPALAWTVKGAQALLDAATAVLIAAIALRLAGRRAAYCAGAIHAVGFLPVFFSAQLLDTTLYTFLAVASLRLAYGAVDERVPSAWLAAGTAAGLAAIARATMLFSIPVLALAPWLAPGRTARRLRDGALVLAGALAMILPVTLMNLRGGGDFVLISSNGGINLYIGNRRGGTIGADGLTSVHAGPRWNQLLALAAHLEKPSERSAHYSRLARREIADDPAAFAGRIAVKLHALVHSFDIPNNKNLVEETERSWALRLLPGRSGLVIPLVLAGLLFSRTLLRRRALLIAMLATQAAVPVLFFVAARYRVPLLAIGAVPAGAALAVILDRAAPARLRATLALTALLLAPLLAWDPHGWRDRFRDYTIDPVSLGFALEQDGDIDGARRYYERALAIDPGHPAAEVQLGTLALVEGRGAEAEARFRRAVASDPDFALAWNSLGQVLHASRRYDEAASCYERSIAADPGYAPPLAGLGQMLEGAGRLAEARPRYEAARRLDPGRPLYWLLEARLLWRMRHPSGVRTILASLEKSAARPLDAQEEKLRKEIIEDLEIWPDGPPMEPPPAPGGEEEARPGG